jgi:PPOX class probable F420-dependent enzyme
MHDRGVLGDAERRFLSAARRAVLVTVDPAGLPRPVPVCHAVVGDTVVTPLDEKPKSSADPLDLARVRDIEARPDVVLLVDRWSEDWSALGWLRVYGRASIVRHDEDGHAEAVAALRDKYAQYAGHRLDERPVIRVVPVRSRVWGAIG